MRAAQSNDDGIRDSRGEHDHPHLSPCPTKLRVSREIEIRWKCNAPLRAKLTNWRDSSADGNGLSVPHSTEVNSQEHLRHGGELMGRFYDLVRYEMMDDLTFTYHFTTRLIVHHPSVGPNFLSLSFAQI